MKTHQDKCAGSGDGLQIYTLGEFSVRRGPQTLSNTSRRSSRLWSLFNYLVINRFRSVAADELVEAVWDDTEDMNNPEHALRELIYRLRKVLGGDLAGQDGEMILSSQGRYRLNSDGVYWLDAEEFEQLCSRGAQIADSDPDAAMAALEQALALYKGDYLEHYLHYPVVGRGRHPPVQEHAGNDHADEGSGGYERGLRNYPFFLGR